MNLPDARRLPPANMSMDTQLETVFDALEDGILVVDDQWRLVWLNRACRRLLRIDPAADEGACPLPAVRKFLESLGIARGEEFPDGRQRPQRLQLGSEPTADSTDGPDSASVPVEAVLTFSHFGSRRIITAAIRDISVQQQMERDIYDARKTQAIASLAGGIAHDFNNILTAIISQIDLVIYGGEIPAALRQHLVYAQTGARRGAELVSKLQAFSRQSTPKFEAVDLADVVDQAVFMLRRGVTPLVQLNPPANRNNGPFTVRADTNQVLQVILNIGINARDAMPKGGSISFTLDRQSIAPDMAARPRRAGEFVCLRIHDTGQGMSAEIAARVFEPYFTTKNLSPGPGLGLSIAASVVAEHQGWIEVASTEGKGSTFSIYLPLSESPAAPQLTPLSDGKPAEGRERILVVDDEELVRMVTKAVLAYRGYQIFEASDGEEAVRKYAESDPRFDLVLMDLHMPRLNGYDALLRIRQINPQLKAVLVSGGSQDPASLGGDIEGVTYLQKPYNNQELTAVVRRLLDAK